MSNRTVLFRSGATREVPDLLSYPIVGLNAAGQVVVELDADPRYLLALTSCCSTFDHVIGEAVVCRECGNVVTAQGVADHEVVDVYEGSLLDGQIPEPNLDVVPTETVWIWFGQAATGVETVLMVLTHDQETNALAYRMLLALDPVTAEGMGVHAQGAATGLNLRAVCREFQLVQISQVIEP